MHESVQQHPADSVKNRLTSGIHQNLCCGDASGNGNVGSNSRGSVPADASRLLTQHERSWFKFGVFLSRAFTTNTCHNRLSNTSRGHFHAILAALVWAVCWNLDRPKFESNCMWQPQRFTEEEDCPVLVTFTLIYVLSEVLILLEANKKKVSDSLALSGHAPKKDWII